MSACDLSFALICLTDQVFGDTLPFNSQDLISSSLYCLPNESHYVSLENLATDQLVIT